jgi:protein gp37
MINSKSKIEWTESTWNPITGCTKVSPGCKNCYAERMANRLQAMGKSSYNNGFKLSIHEETFDHPLKIKKPKLIFVNSMSDLFHEEVPNEVIYKLIEVMKNAHWHTFQILTKRAERLNNLNTQIEWPNNVWVGVSVESNDYKYRIDLLRSINSKIRFLSIEPLIGEITELNLINIDWVIVGGESGPKARNIEKEWVIKIKDYCLDQKVPFFFKQWGGTNKKKNGRLLEGITWDEMPIK